ncbi:unnamed protein product [Echinostoma caproni]|uniref:Reverse transcriptase domain-containing protein n=1 Tax=Echinostoma caproni TaxID=27848 RepID=A0A183A134_9TREM|nr:unnamed protein product [Echinostoma caproni]
MLPSHYASVYTPTYSTLAHPLDTDTALNWTPFTIGELALALRRLKVHQSPGPDGMQPLILKEQADERAAPLCNLFNLSFTQERLPRQWKDAVIVPLPKVGDRSNPGSYRPVSLTSVASRSCLLNLLLTRECWSEDNDKEQETDIIFVDFSKAFNKLPHGLLL